MENKLFSTSVSRKIDV